MATIRIGQIVDGFRFKGGDPNSQENWADSTLPPSKGEVVDGYVFKGGDLNSPDSWEEYKEPVAEKPKDTSRTFGGTVKDIGITALKGAIGVPETAVGLADIASGGRAGKLAEDIGVNFKDAKRILNDQKSEAQKLADAKVENAEGFVDTTLEAIKNPSVIATTVGESLPSMLGGGLIGKGIIKVAPKVSALIGGAIGEGVVGAGSQAEGVRQQTDDGLLTGKQAALSGLTGVLTGAIGAGSGKIANKLGISDIDTVLAGGTIADSIKSLPKKLGQGALTEGVLEELPQSVQEQILSNAALDKPLLEGVDNAAALGMLSGGVMGAGAQLLPNNINRDRLIIDNEGMQQDEDLANQLQAEYDAKTAEADNALANITNPDATVEDAIALAEKALDIPAAPGLLNSITETPIQTQGATEAINAADILGDDNVSNQNDAATGLATGTIESADNNVQGSVADLSVQPDLGRVDNTTGPLTAGEPGNVATGTGSTADSTLGETSIDGAFNSLGKGAVDNLYSGLFKSLKAGKDTFAGIKDNVLVRAKPYFEAGLIKTPEDLRLFENKGYPALPKQATPEASTADRPFATADNDFLPKMRSMTTDAKVISQIDAELALRGLGAPSAVEVAGEKINKEWTAFNPDTGTLNIPRAEMPQIKAEHRGAMVNFLNARGISHEQETVPASSLKPTQQEFSEAKVKQASEYVGGDRSILVSSDNHVLDGHHQWLSKLQNNDNVDVIRLNAPIKDLLTNVSEFPSAQVAEGAKQVSTPKPKTAKPKAPKIKSLLTTINDLGGILNSEKLDITGEQRGFAPGGYNKIFKLNSKRSLKGLIEGGDLDEYLPYNMRLEANGMNDDAFDSTEAYDYLADRIRNGESVLPYAVEEEIRALQYQGNAVADVADELTEDEINGQLQQASNEERESATNAQIFDTDSAESGIASSVGTESTAETDTSQQAQQVAQDLLGDNTAAKQALADAERTKDAKRNTGKDNPESFTLTGSTSEADQAAAAGAQDLFAAPTKTLADYTNDGKQAFLEGLPRNVPQGISAMYGAGWLKGWDRANIDAPIEADAAPADTQKSKDETRFADNKVFTADKVAAARARLKSKLNTLNSGIDPELLIDGMTIAGAYIESGVRKFSDYTKAMTDDFGDSIKPYLLSFYEAARAYPGIDKDGMTDADAAATEHQALLTPAVKEMAKEVIGQGVVTTPKAKAKPNGQLKLTQDWGVDDINGYDSDRDNGRGGEIKDAFLKEAKNYLTQVSKLLEAEGFEPHKDQRGRTQKAVSVNEAGPAVSGEASLTMRKGNVGVYVDIGTSAIRGLTGNHPQGVSVMIRATDKADTDRYATKGQNIWLSTDLNSTELANKLVQTAERYVKNTLQAEQGANDARTNQTEQVQPGRAQSDLLTEQSRNSDSEPMDARLAGSREESTGNRTVSGSIAESSGNGTPGTSGSNRNESSSRSRETSNAGNQTGTANAELDDFEITDGTGIGEGSPAQKYKDNIAAIKLIKTLESEGRVATPEERDQLAKYNGFGALSKVFEKNNPKYQELKDLLTEAEYDAANASILNAYYTSPTIVKNMYDAIGQLGFKGGRVLEPSLGSGNFFGMMPAAMRNKSKLNGVELDVITSRLAKYLYPNANIAVATGFEKYQAPQGYFDLVISNPPFGSEQLRDSEKAEYSGFSIHNFFIAKSIDKLRDGGVMAVVVSHNFMDAQNSQAREWIAKRANLISAVRLPRTAFKENAGTEVITDILYFQKTATPQANPDWIKATNQGDYTFNDYFYANPRNVLGRIADITNQYGKTFTIEPTGDLKAQLKEFNSRLQPGIYIEPTQRIEVLDSADNTVPDTVKVGTFYKDSKGIIRQRMPDMLGAKRSTAWEVPNAKAQERMSGMMDLRDFLRTQMRLERDPMATTKEIERNRERLNLNYDSFLRKHGYLNSVTNRRLFLDDTESALVQALEIDYDQGVTAAKSAATGMEEKPASAQKADIFKNRVLFPPSDSINVNNAKDALLASLNVKGVVDADYMSEVYNKSAEEVISELGDVIYDDPQKGLVTADEYLSGDVKTKLAEAKVKAAENGKYARNVEALEKVIPADKMPSEIYASAGANWIPADVYAQFASEITGIPLDGIEFTYVKAAAIWLSEKTRGGDAGKMTSEFGTQDINAFDLFHMVVNGKAPEVKETVGSGYDRRTVTNIEKTEAARSKYEKIKEAWNSWIFKDAARADRLATIYNDKHNRTVARKFDGSHMQFYGMSPSVTLRAHQKDVVWRAIQDRNVLLDHVVGAGKTMAAASIAMEMKRLGIARKPLFVVPNHLTLQWRSEFTKLYPASNILAATPEDFAKDKREKLFSKMVTGNYDAIIIGHSSLTKIGLPAEVEEKMYAEQVKEIADAIESAKTERGDRGITRDMEKIKANLEAKIKKLKEKAGVKDNVVTFDELGIDALVVDEMHEFKNLFFTTQMQRTAGLGNPAGSGKALDLFMKIRFMNEIYGEDFPLVTMTGTPVSNSLAEMFTMQRYMQYSKMKRMDLNLFDAWAKQFGEVENVYEVAPSGVGYRQSTRFSKFKNLPALMGSYTSFADIITMQDLKDQTAAVIDEKTGKPKVFPVPKLRTGKPINVIAQRSELQRDFFGVPQLATDENTGAIQFELDAANVIIEQNKEGKYQLINQVINDNGEVTGRQAQGSFDTREEAELELVTKSLTPKTFIDPKSLLGQFANLAELTRKSEGKINALSLTGLANKSGLDYRIIDPSAPDFAGSKINLAVGNMVELWKETAKDKGAQIVFCDLSIPNSARNDMSSKERRIYVRDRDGELTHKAKGVVYAPEGFEGFPFYITKGRNSFEVYEAVTGTLVRDYNMADKATAKAWIASYVEAETNRNRVFALRDTKTIEQADIDEYREAKELELADDGSNEISTADMEAVAGSSKFSVYDDIRAKLIKQGVPENQIAFIHDYNTPKQKEELFKRVNSGDVRFLFGSTPKLGAGTNVQKRLVGLHHIDAPWRPSDLEQREGRIIRQGNDLYARDPENFEIAIWRYATEQTYDTRRWQLLEHKAAGIEQLRKYTGEAEIEDVASEAANSADMKAAASGNPLILEETKLRTEVKRLINLEKAHADSQYNMARTIKNNTDYINNYWPNRISEYKDAQAEINKYPVPEDKAKIANLKVDGALITSREKAEAAISALALDVRSQFTLNETPKVIQYRGIEFTINRGFALNSLALRSPDGLMHTYGEKEGVSPSGLITRFNNYIDSLQSRIDDVNERIAKAKVENESLSKRENEPFEYSEKLKETQANHAKVKRRLMKSSQLESVPEEQRAEFDSLVKARKAELVKLGFEKALKESEADNDTTVFSRNTKATAGLTKAAVQKAVNAIRANWKNAPEIIVVDDMNDQAIRTAVREENDRQLSQGAKGQPEGFFDAGKVYIVASEMNSADDIVRVMFHETLGHYGLRGTFGKELGAILDRVALLRKSDMAKKAKQYGLNLNKVSDKSIVAEEVLAEIAQTAPQLGFVKSAIAAIRKFLRAIGVKLELSDNDIINDYIIPARSYVVNGRSKQSPSGLVLAFSRESNVNKTETEAFKKWFGNSKVVDADGKPLVVYHGTDIEFSSFDKKKIASRFDYSFGFHFTTRNQEADIYAGEVTRASSPTVMPVYLKAENPLVINTKELTASMEADFNRFDIIAKIAESKNTNNPYDSVIIKRERGNEYDGWNVIVFNPNQIKSAIGNNGDFDPANPDIRFSRNNPQSSLTPSWAAPSDSKMDNVVYALQDKNIDLKRVTSAIKAAGTQISDRWNAYLQEELYHGRTAKRTQDFIKTDLEPLIEDMRMRGVAMADFEEYLWARHAPERNKQIASINPKMPDGGSGMSTQDALDYMANLSTADKTKYEALARRIDLITRKSRQVLIDYGLESTATIAAWEGAYQHYIPLMREDMDAGFGNGTGQGFSIKGNASKRATGSNRAVVDVIANIAQQYEKNIIRGEKNRVATALIGLAKLNPNADFWEVDTPPKIKTIIKGGTVYDVLENGNKVAEFTNKNAARNFVNSKGITGYAIDERQAADYVDYVTDQNYKNRNNVVVARIVDKLGKIQERSVIFNQFDERAIRMAESIKNLDQDQISHLLAVSSSFTRYFASINTQYNPVFGIINITRDVQGALLNLSSTPIADKKAEVLGNTLKALKGIYQDVRSQRKTGVAASNQWATLYEEFQREGGQTGYRNMYANAKDRSEALRDALDPTWWKDSKLGKVISANGMLATPEQWIADKAIKPIFDWLSDYNNSLENAVRLSVYKSALDAGQTKQQAASIAKNISVNFNRKGSYGRQIGSLYAFFNASVQGTARIGETMMKRDNTTGKMTFSKAGVRIMQGGLLLGAMQALLLAAAGYDEDEPPQFIRDRNLIIPLDPFGADGKYVSIPMPLGYNAIPSTGRMLTEFVLSGGKNPGKRIIALLNMLLDVTNPIGNAGLSMQTISPTVLDPFAALSENKDFTGRPISREDLSSLSPTPGFTRSRDKAWDFSVTIAQGINWLTGGTDATQGAISPTADQIEYLAGQFTGGVGRETIKLGTTVDSFVTGEELPTYKIPLFGRLYGNTTGQSSQGTEFYNNIRRLNEHQAEIKLLQENNGDLDAYLEKNPEAMYFRSADRVYRNISKLRKNQRILKEEGNSKAEVTEIDNTITELMQNFNDSIREAKEQEAI